MKKNVVNNVVSLYGLTIAKLIFPLLTLPYLMRVLSLDSYGVVSYVKTVISYIQIIIDFAFVVSGTKDIVKAKNNIVKINEETSVIMFSRILLSIFAFILLFILVCCLPLLKNYKLYTLLSFVSPFLSIFLFDYVFRGLEKMETITIRFLIAKSISTVLTFVLVKNDSDILMIPFLDFVSSLVSALIAFAELSKYDIHPFRYIAPIKQSINKIRTASIYFLSNVANHIFSTINTILIGFFLSSSDIAYWSICIQIVNSIQNLYYPIIDGLYPEMIKTRNISYIKKTFYIMIPIIFLGCIFTFVVSEPVLIILGGDKYAEASLCLRSLIPVLFFSFPSMFLGWPTLGAIDRQEKVTLTLTISAIFQLVSIGVLLLFKSYNLFSISIVRSITEIVLFLSRLYFVLKYEKEFSIK